jgi:hypothetical protein
MFNKHMSAQWQIPIDGSTAHLRKWKILIFGTGVLHLIQINHQPDATVFQFIILMFVYDTKVKPEAATAVIELLMMGGKTPEIC